MVCYHKTKSLQSSKCTGLASWEKHTHMIISKWFRFIIAKIYNILRYAIARILRNMCNLYIKETEISQKRSKGIKNWKITYSVILSVSNKTNLILGFSALLKDAQMASNPCQTRQQTCFSFFMPQDPSINHLNFYCIKQIDYIFPCVSVCVL